MAETAVQFLLNKISSLAEEKLRLLSGVRKDIWFIENRLQQWQAMIKEAEAATTHDEELKVWVKQVREVVYEAEDVFDEVMVRLPFHQARGFCGYIVKTYHSTATLRIRDVLASKIQDIVPKIKAIDEKEQVYRQKIDAIRQQRGSSASTADEAANDGREAALLIDRHELVGIDGHMQRLMGLLQLVEGGNDGVKVVAVYGTGGLGKSTLVKNVFDEVRAGHHFRTCAFLPFSNLYVLNNRLLIDLIQQLYSECGINVPDGLQYMDSTGLKGMIKSFLSQNSFLIAFDDVWSTSVWEAIRPALPSLSYGRVMVTTRNADIASCCASAFGGHEYELSFLSSQDASTLFCRKTFKADACRPGFEELCSYFLQKCEGLPLAILAVSSILAARNQLKAESWDMVLRSLGAEIESNDRFRQMKMVLLHSYNDLEYHLRFCFMYMSIFPEGQSIQYARLLRLWIAEGFVRETEGKSYEEVARLYFDELCNKSLIHVVERTSDGRIKTCRILHFFREIFIQKSRDHNFAEIDRGQNITWPQIIRRLSVQGTLRNIQRNMNVSRLRSLVMFGVADSLPRTFISKMFNTELDMLTVLDLQGASITEFPVEVVDLIHLKYISLRSTKVERIPKRIKKLKHLQTLDLKHTNIKKLPVEILKLKLLRYLLVYRYRLDSYPQFNYKHGFYAPANIGDLQSLEKLCSVEVDQNKLVVQLGRLTQLRKLSISKVKKEHGQALCSSIQKMGNLRSLSVTSVGEGEIIDLENIHTSPKYLRQLYLTGRLERVPQWIQSLHNLGRLHLKWSQLSDDPLRCLEDLPNLAHLELLRAYDGETLTFAPGKFKELKFLGLDNFEQLKRVNLSGAMPHLEKLIIQRCQSLEDVPSGIESLLNIKILELFDMPDAFISSLRQGQERINHIPKVYSSKLGQGGWIEEELRGPGSSSQASTVRTGEDMRHCWK